VVGVQAQDPRAAGLALRSRVPGLRRADVDGSGLVRTWTVRGTAHLVDPPDLPWLQAAVDPDLALVTLAQRYLAGYGPAAAADLASWSGLPLSTARRALATLDHTEAAGELLALPGTLDAEPQAPAALLLAAFDTVMLGYRTREPMVAAGDDRHILPGGGMLRPAVLIDGLAAATWGLSTQGRRRTVAIRWFGRPAESAELHAEQFSVEKFLGCG